MDVTTPQQASGEALRPPERGISPTRACLNCGAGIQGLFCASCGQRDIPAFPTMRELVVDTMSELSGWDGRLASTLRHLLAHPGQLTREFLEGRRARHIAPMRLYLVASLAYFVLAAAAPDVKLDSGRSLFVGLRFGVTTTEAPSPAGDDDQDPGGRGAPMTPEQRAALLAEIDSAPSLVRPFLRKAMDDPDALRRSVFETLPRIFFVLLPLFAAIVALLYHGRKFPEHLYFAIHLHAFGFLALAATEALKYTRWAPVVIAGAVASLLAIPVYTALALRRVYGGTIGLTILKEAAIVLIYGAFVLVSFVATLFWVAGN